MRSTSLIHEIVCRFGSDDNRDLYKALKALRMQVRKEVISTILNADEMIKLKYQKQ